MKFSRIIIAASCLFLFSSCTGREDHPSELFANNQTFDQDNEAQGGTENEEIPAPEGASERAASTLAVPETIVDGVILPEYYEFEYPDDFRSFMDSCIEYSQNEDIDALSDLCGFGGTNQDAVNMMEQYCLGGIGVYQFHKHRRWTWGSDKGRDQWNYSFWYEGYRCILYFSNEERTDYDFDWMEFWLIPDNGKGYAAFFYPASKYHGENLEFLIIDCKNGIFDGEFQGIERYPGSGEDYAMSGNLTGGLLDGESIRGDETMRYENGRLMEYWRTDDPSNVTDADGYYMNLQEYVYTAGHRRCVYEKTDRGIVWDPF